MNGALDSGLDRWLQRGAVAAMVAIAVMLLGIGVLLYAKPANAQADSNGNGGQLIARTH